MFLIRYFIIFCLTIFCLLTFPINSAWGQFPTIQDLILYSNNLLHNNSKDEAVASCIRIDGRCVFEVAYPKSELSARVNEIQERLNEIKNFYLNRPNSELEVFYRQDDNGLNIYVTVNGNPSRLLNITQQDAEIQGMTPEGKANFVERNLEKKLLQAKEEREYSNLIRQGIIAIITCSAIALLSLLLSRWLKVSRATKKELKKIEDSWKIPFLNNLNQQKNWHIQEIKYRLLQTAQFFLWGGGLLLILGLFPQTRAIQLILITAIRLPLRVIVIGFATYLSIRLLYSLINSLFSTIVGSQFVLSPRANKRLQLRVNTISQVSKSIVAILLIVMGFLFSLAAIGVDVTPFLAGAGIIGLALSFASQSILKDALNGFFIIFEDQYGVGDIIDLNGVGGMVENINLRITQIRDAEGRLISIPNSEVKIVANRSSQWSRADINIPLGYNTDINLAFKVIEKVANEINQDSNWQQFILESPQILGVENFSDRGIIIRIWIKTEPLKQWDISREFRRRLHLAFNQAGIPLIPPQQEIFIQEKNKNKESL